ncbi:hypothetical protein H3N56_11140 [Cetobacterium sp. 2A]|uniref:hypothetical protein n=1 Tax=Cetobacterium sp. 2A TaxID=2754723 RepID=UPI00163CE8CC|nr:hypothetical protein [Cetobacterium sp. 2A]MBC2856987.1 hypothetical protein [Cetobacterium sp. 2A]
MEKLKTALQERLQPQNKEIIGIENLNFKNNSLFLGEDGDYLKQKSYEVALITIKGSLALGKIFKEVIERLGNNKTGTYERWLEFNGFHKRTALRYRKKYELYQSVNPEKRSNVALMSFELIEKISNENIKEYIELINSGITTEDLKIELADKKIQKSEKEEKKDTSFDFNFKVFENLEDEIKQLDNKKKQRVEKLLLEIKKLLKK